jgi:hypothetical protein
MIDIKHNVFTPQLINHSDEDADYLNGMNLICTAILHPVGKKALADTILIASKKSGISSEHFIHCFNVFMKKSMELNSDIQHIILSKKKLEEI